MGRILKSHRIPFLQFLSCWHFSISKFLGIWPKYSLRGLIIIGIVLLLGPILVASANVANPQPLDNHNGDHQVYDEEENFWRWGSGVQYVNEYHKDGTNDSHGNYNNGGWEYVTQIPSGSYIQGKLHHAQGFGIEAAAGNSFGTVTVKVCGTTLGSWNRKIVGGADGYNNLPGFMATLPANLQNVDCTFEVDASGGPIDYRLASISIFTPSVTLTIDGASSVSRTANTAYTLSWSSQYTDSCTASGSWSGGLATGGSQYISGVGPGTYTYSITCNNSLGDTASATVYAYVYAPPSLSLAIDGTSSVSKTSPAAYTVSWSTANATACTKSDTWTGSLSPLTSGSTGYNNVGAGTYTYSVTCQNALGYQVSANVYAYIYSPASLSLTIDGVSSITRTSPTSFTLAWSTSNASSCTKSGSWSGALTPLASGSTPYTSVGPGTYTYTVTCQNAIGTQNSASVTAFVYAPPSVFLTMDGGAFGPRTAPASYTVAWISTGSTSCSGSNRMSGLAGLTASKAESSLPIGTYTYGVTCQNAAGATASDTKSVTVYVPASVDVKVNNLDGPLTFVEPASFTVSWTSSNATACTAKNNLTGPIGTNGTIAYASVMKGSYIYGVQCVNAAGTAVSDSVSITVNAQPPSVDLLVDNSNGPITKVSPADFVLSWTSQYATTCSVSSSDGLWTGNVPASGSSSLSQVGAGSHTYTINCSNASGTATDSILVIVTDPLSGQISAKYSTLIYFASLVGQPSQLLTGIVSGGKAPYLITVRLRSPSSVETTYPASGNSWTLSASETGDPDFGTIEEGVWTAWAVITDNEGRIFTTGSATWVVKWFPVHGLP